MNRPAVPVAKKMQANKGCSAARERGDSPRWVARVLPFTVWLHGYGLPQFGQDALAGVTLALVLIPQSMAYARLAGLPPYYGLYAALLPPCVGALFGSSRQLATGPVAMVSLMTAAALGPLAQTGTEGFVAYACLLAMLVGLVQLGLGLLRLGIIVNLVSHPVLIGFTNAAALIIATSQIPDFFGVAAVRADHHYETVLNAVRAVCSYTHWPTVAMGGGALAIMLGLKRLHPRIPAVLVAAVLTTTLSWLLGFENNATCVLARLEPSEIRQTAQSYNAALTAGDQAKLALLDLDRQIKECETRWGLATIKAIQLKYQHAEVDLKIQELNKEAAQYRASLRNARFLVGEGPRGERCFCLQGACPPDRACGGRLWRLKVAAEQPIDEHAVTLMGGGVVVGQVPSGLPRAITPWTGVDPWRIPELIGMALFIALVGFMEAISIGKAIASRTDQRVDPNQELLGQGLANITGAFFQSYPVSGSFSRTAVNYHAGAYSGIASVCTSLIVLLVLLFFTPLLYYLPQSVLAAVIVVAALGLISVQGFVKAWRIRRDDAVVALVTFAATLWVAPHLEVGITIGVLLSLALLVFRQMKPRTAILSKFADGSYRDSERRGLACCEHVLVMRFNGALSFVNAIYLEERLMAEVATRPELRCIVLVGNGINDIDVAGTEVLSSLFRKLRFDGYEVYISGLNDTLQYVMRRSRLIEVIGEANLFPNVAAAVAACRHKAATGGAPLCPAEACPLTSVQFSPAAGVRAMRE